MRHGIKKIIVLNLHRLHYGSGKGDATCLSQHNRSNGSECTDKKCRKEILKEIKDYLHEINKRKEAIILGDLN